MHTCLECGKVFYEMRVHLKMKHRMTVDEYNKKHNVIAPVFTFPKGRKSVYDYIADSATFDAIYREQRRKGV